MGVVEDVYVPSYNELINDIGAEYWNSPLCLRAIESKKKFTELYDSVMEALYYVASYKLLYERARESFGYGETQLESAVKKISEVKDEKNLSIVSDFQLDVNAVHDLRRLADVKFGECNAIIAKLNTYKSNIITRNNELMNVIDRVVYHYADKG